MKINNSSEFDLDLFYGNNFQLFHIATAGLQIKDENFFSNSHNEFRHFLKNFSQARFQYKLNPFLEEIISYKREADPEFDFELYTSDFIKYAQFGLFSFDRTFINKNADRTFHLVAYPILDENYNMLLRQIYGYDINLDFSPINNHILQQINNYYNRSFSLDFL